MNPNTNVTRYPAITTEWAKQLAHDAFGPDLDFANMEVYTVDLPYPTIHLALYQKTVFLNTTNKTHKKLLDYEKVEFFKWFDVINMEVHFIAYGTKTNIFVVNYCYQGLDKL